MRILIVDEVFLMLRSLRYLLQRNGYGVVIATSGEQALECLSTDLVIDVVISELTMQPMNGVELFRKAQRIERFNDTGVLPPPSFVLLTSCEKTSSRASWEAELDFARREFASIVQKPVSEKELIPALEQISFQKSTEAKVGNVLAESLCLAANKLRTAREKTAVSAIVRELQQELESLECQGRSAAPLCALPPGLGAT